MVLNLMGELDLLGRMLCDSVDRCEIGYHSIASERNEVGSFVA